MFSSFPKMAISRSVLLGRRTVATSTLSTSHLKAFAWQHGAVMRPLEFQHPATPVMIGWVGDREEIINVERPAPQPLKSRSPPIRKPVPQAMNARNPLIRGKKPVSPQKLGEAEEPETMNLMNRNARRGKRANHGKRPCSRHHRRTKKRAFGNHRR